MLHSRGKMFEPRIGTMYGKKLHNFADKSRESSEC